MSSKHVVISILVLALLLAFSNARELKEETTQINKEKIIYPAADNRLPPWWGGIGPVILHPPPPPPAAGGPPRA